MKRRILAMLLCMAMVITSAETALAADTDETAEQISVEAVTEEVSSGQENNNDADYDPESWDYSKYLDGEETAVTVLAEDDVTNTLTVHVTATDATTGETVPVQGAIAALYSGDIYREAESATDADGNAVISLEGLSKQEKLHATVSAYKTIAQGGGLLSGENDGRGTLFNNFPKDEDGNYIRYQIQLHSETIDNNGGWAGANIPTNDSNQVDMVFAIDATGSMSSSINDVKDNISTLAETLVSRGLDIRFAFIEYRDITCDEPMKLWEVDGSPWCTDLESVVNILAEIDATGGGDSDETTVDALGMVADAATMKWRSEANKFAFVLTDADTKTDNNYGYTDLQDVTDALAEQDITTSIITDTRYQSSYQTLYETTGGIFADIYSDDFGEEMLALAENVTTTIAKEMTLNLHEPRMMVNMSVCYLAEKAESKKAEYQQGVKRMLNEYAKDVAQATDGHVLIDNILLFTASNLQQFYNTANRASKADIRIETDESSWGKIHSNAYVSGFYDGSTVSVTDDYIDLFNSWAKNMKGASELSGKSTYRRIQMSGVEGAGWNNSMLDEAAAYATTVTHETGHYLLCFFDEYMDGDGINWTSSNRPYSNFGLMDGQHEDIEISKANIDYAYRGGDFTTGADTRHSSIYHQSCEGTLAEMLETGRTLEPGSLLEGADNYVIDYTEVSGSRDRTANYSYASLTDDDYIILSSTGTSAAGDELLTAAKETTESLGAVSVEEDGDGLRLMLVPTTDADYHLYVQTGDSYEEVALTAADDAQTAELNVGAGALASFRIVAESGEEAQYNQYYIDRSESNTGGYAYVSMDCAVNAYTIPESETVYTYVADNTTYTNGEYQSINQATAISTKDDVGLSEGKIYSVASCTGDMDYSSLSWFKYAGGVWTQLDTEYLEEEDDNVGASAELSGDGLYVLMAKAASKETAKPATNVTYTQSEDNDAVVTVAFDDPNENSKFYHVYYSDSAFDSAEDDGVVQRTYPADSTELTLDLLEREREVYLAVQSVQEDGSKSELSEAVRVTAGAADKDGDGIPDWYCDKYGLWAPDGTEKDIANSDDDGDGLTNLEEYEGGSDPLDPDDPVHTSNIAVGGVTVTPGTLELDNGTSATITAEITPLNADNQNVEWSVADKSVASIKADGKTCVVTAKGEGSTTVTVKTADGGYAAKCAVTVIGTHVHEYQTKIVKASPDKAGSITKVCSCGEVESERIIAAPASAELSNSEYVYSGKTKHPKVEAVYDTNGRKISSSNYETTLPNNKKVGTYEMTVTFVGDYYEGTLTSKFVINPRATTIKSITRLSKGFKVKWTKKISQTSGYQVQYWKKNAGAKKTETISDANRQSKTISKLARNTSYYVRVRTYKTVNGKWYYSSWSKKKTVKTR